MIQNNESENKFNICCVNPGGLQSKYLTVSNMAVRNKIDAIICSETHFSGKRKPFVSKEFTPYFKNRSRTKICKGGIAIFLRNEIAEHSVLLETGDNNEEEFLCVKVNYFDPPLVIFAAYGPQQNKTNEEIDKLWNKYHGLWQRYQDLGYSVIAGGDFNAAVGVKLGLKNNHPSQNYAGELLIREVKNLGWTVVNSLDKESDHRTHVDRSSSSSRCLDYLITNSIEKCIEAKIDNQLVATPYNVIMENGLPKERKFSDHKTVMAAFEFKKAKVKKLKQPAKFIRDDDSRAEFNIATEDIAEKAIEMLDNEEDTTKIINMVTRQIRRAQYKTLKVVKPNKEARITQDDAIFWNLTNQLEKEIKNIDHLKLDLQIHNVRKKGKMAERGDPLFSMRTKSGDLADTKEMIEDVILQHNKDLLKRKDHPPAYKQIHNMKKQLLDTLLQTEIKEFNTFTFRDYLKIVKKVYVKKKPMFNTFMDSSAKYKVMIFWLLKRIYEEETIPESFFDTELVALFKKGDQKDPGNYRYLQLKKDLPRLFEMAVYLKIENTFEASTSEAQAGGKKNSDTVEN